MFNNKKLSTLIAVFMVLALVLTACGPSQTSDTETTTTKSDSNATTSEASNTDVATSEDPKAGPAVDKDTVVICTADETPSLTTADHNAVAGDYVNKLTHNGLFRLDKELNPQPDLVEDYHTEKDDNGEDTVWIMKIYDGIKFHDDSTMTAEDVIASIENAKKSSHVDLYTKSIATIEKVDDLTVKITTNGPSASLLYDLSHHGNYIVPKALLDAGNDFNKNPIGAGAYKFVEWKRGEQLEFTAHENYFDKDRAPKIKNIVWKIIPEGSSRTIALEASEVDYIIELDSTSINSLESNPNTIAIKQPSVSHSWLTVNNEKKPFDDVNVRKAVNAAINKEDVLIVALNDMGIVASSQTPTGMLGEYTGEYDSYDLDKAKEYLATWGGDPATIELDVICSNDTKRRAAEVIQSNLKEIGIDMTISSMDLATYLSETAAGNFTGFIGGYTSNEMMSFLKGVFHSSNIDSSNKTRTNNPELDALIDKSSSTIDQAEREKVLQEATKVLNENCYQMPLYQSYMLSAHKTNLDNTFITPGGTFFVQEWTWK